MEERNDMRLDLRVIASWIHPGSKVLGLGCGEGELLYFLKKNKQVKETGIELKEARAAKCIEKGLSVLQGDINEEIMDYPDNSFDYVVLSQTLQQVYEPSALIKSMLRVGKKGIVSFPNFSHWKIRIQLMWTGYVPVTKELPYKWHDTPNIRVLSLKDFRQFIDDMDMKIIKEAAINTGKNEKGRKVIRLLPNFFATYGIFLIGNRR